MLGSSPQALKISCLMSTMKGNDPNRHQRPIREHIEVIEREIGNLQAKLAKLRAKLREEGEEFCDADVQHFTIEFDGGSSCNIPRLGYGRGYGSYQINGGEIHRVEFGSQGMSANAAEIRTLACALETLATMHNPAFSIVLARGDSKIALKWATTGDTPKDSTSQGFRDAITFLRQHSVKFKSIKTQWRGRAHSVNLFGH